MYTPVSIFIFASYAHLGLQLIVCTAYSIVLLAFYLFSSEVPAGKMLAEYKVLSQLE